MIANPDFQEVSGSSPQNWFGFGDSSISIAPDVKFNGKNCCVCTKRQYPYSGISQNVAYAVQTGQLFTVIPLVLCSTSTVHISLCLVVRSLTLANKKIC